MATFVLTGLSVEKVSQAEQKNLREALGGGFHVSVELTGSNPYFRMDDDGTIMDNPNISVGDTVRINHLKAEEL